MTSQYVACSLERPLQFQCRLECVLDTFSDVFGDDLGCCSQSVSIHVRPDAELKVFPFRRQLIHLLTKIEAELDRQVNRGVLEPVDTALCAFPTVNVIKSSDTVRICGD